MTHHSGSGWYTMDTEAEPLSPTYTNHTNLDNMHSDECTLSKAAEIVDLASIVVDHLKKLRDGTTDDEWDQIIDNQLVDELITACMDLEGSIED